MNKNRKNSKSGFVKIVSVVIILVFILFIVLFNLPQTSKDVKSNVKQTSIKFVKEGELTFQKLNGEYISKIDIEIADTDNKRTRGLMDRISMKENHGMLFLFSYNRIQSFWMKNTVIPLDMIFVNSDNEIVTIQKNAIPFDTGSYASTKPASIVIEVNAGYTDLYGITEGDKIVWRRN